MDNQNIPDFSEQPEELTRLIEETEVEVAGEAQPLDALLKDVKTAHEELDQYKSGALTLSQALDERIMMARSDGDDALVNLLQEVKDSAFGVYLRLQRGDLELLGERDGKHSGYFTPDDEQ